jgi:hypothetical protein
MTVRIRSTSSRASALACFASIGVVLLPCVARADVEPEAIPVRVDYRAPMSCPGESSFISQMTSRSRRIRPAVVSESGPLLEVRVGHGGRGVRGELIIRYGDGKEARRDVDGETCESVVTALALMSVLALDPGAMSAPQPPPESPAEASTNTTLTATPPPSPPVARDESRASKESKDLQLGWHLAVAGVASASGGSSPSLLFDLGGFFEASKATDSVWAPSLRCGFQYASGDQSVSGGAMSAHRAVGTIDFCPLRFRPGPLRLMPCVDVQGGVLTAAGQDIQPSHTDTRHWFTVGAMGSVRYVPISPFFVELDGGLELPLVRDNFYFYAPDHTVYLPPPIAGFAGGAIGVTIL